MSYRREETALSFSGASTLKKCPYSYKANYIGVVERDGRVIFPPRTTSKQLATGQYAHRLVEAALGGKQLVQETTLELLTEGEREALSTEPMIAIHKQLTENTIPSIQTYMQEHNLHFVRDEYNLNGVLPGDTKLKTFRGSIDLVLRDAQGNIVLTDLKACGYQYSEEIRRDSWMQYQLIFYKHFYAAQEGIDPKKIAVEFWFLLKPKFNFNPFFLTSGPKKVENALAELSRLVRIVDGGVFPKKKTSCTYCNLRHTEFCPD